jgi:condensin-2 complex subunit G2
LRIFHPLQDIVAEHSSDASSSAVRAGALNAITLLLEAPQSHAVLRALLPSLGNLIHDKVEKVRLAAVRLLLCIKHVPGIKYYHCVPVDHLSARLADEGRHNSTGPVASALTALMLNSYFPQGPNVSGVAQIKRTIAFLTSDPAASAVFYANVSDHLPVDAIAKLAAMLLRCLHSAVDTDQKAEKKQAKGRKRLKFGKQTEDDEEDEENEDESFISASDTALMANLAETICTLWHSIEDRLSHAENEECDRFLLDSFSGVTLTNALTHFEAKAQGIDADGDDEAESTREDCHRICAAILRTAGRLPSKAVEGLVPHISSVLASLSQTDSLDSPRQNVTAHIALLCLWDMTEEVAPSLAASIQSPFEGDHELIFGSPSSDSKKRKSGRSKKKDHLLAVPPLPPRVALDVLGDILRGSDPSSVAARGSIFASISASSAIEKALQRGTKYAERLLSAESVSPGRLLVY